MCSAEVQRLSELSGGTLAVQNVHAISDLSGLPDRRQLLQTLHYRDVQGILKTGLSANVAAWQHTRYATVWRCLEWPVVRFLASRIYDWWAAWRYRRLYGDEDR